MVPTARTNSNWISSAVRALIRISCGVCSISFPVSSTVSSLAIVDAHRITQRRPTTVTMQHNMHGKLHCVKITITVRDHFRFWLISSDKIHGFEYPPGQRIIVKPLNEAKSNADAVFSFDGKCRVKLNKVNKEIQTWFCRRIIKRTILKCSTATACPIGQSDQPMCTTLFHCVRSKGTLLVTALIWSRYWLSDLS